MECKHEWKTIGNKKGLYHVCVGKCGIQTKISKMKLQELETVKEVFIKPNGLINYRLMEVTKTQDGFTISNYGNELIEGHEWMFVVRNQANLDALDVKMNT